jgi:hypothetical protein
MKQKNKTFSLADWKPRDLLKHAIWQIFSDNRIHQETFWYAASIGLKLLEKLPIGSKTVL